MKVHVKNEENRKLTLPWPFKAEIVRGGSSIFEFEDSGHHVAPLLSIVALLQSKGTVSVKVFRGDPQKEYKVSGTGAFPRLQEV